MFEADNSWSLPAHLSLVSGWSARCSKHGDPMSCKSDARRAVRRHGQTARKVDFPWTDLTWLLHRDHVSWRYYVANGSQPDCADNRMFCPHVPQSARRPSIWNPLPRFDDVQQDHQLGNIQPLGDFYRAAHKGTLAGGLVDHARTRPMSEHPPALVTAGQTYVTHLINSIMRGPDWKSTAIFLSWDDWGGFYDHVKPPVRRRAGLRHPRARARDQPVRQAGLRRPPGAELRRLPQVHRGRLPARPAARPAHRRPARLTARRAREREDPRQPRPRLRLRPEARRRSSSRSTHRSAETRPHRHAASCSPSARRQGAAPRRSSSSGNSVPFLGRTASTRSATWS